MTTPERLGRSLLCVLAADLIASFLFQFSGVLFGGPSAQLVPALSGLLVIFVASLFQVLPAWVSWLPVLWYFGNPHGRKRVLFIALGILWGPLYLYAMRLWYGMHSAVWRSHPDLQPVLTDGLAMIASTLATFFYLDVLKRSERPRIQLDDYAR